MRFESAVPRTNAPASNPGVNALAQPLNEALSQTLDEIEQYLEQINQAMLDNVPVVLEEQSHALHQRLIHAIDLFQAVARQPDPIPRALQERLMKLNAQVIAQRNALHRATSALDRLVNMLLPQEGAPAYAVKGY